MNLTEVRSQIIGYDRVIPTPYGQRLMTYADYTASGRNVKAIEDYILEIESIYANTHTEDSYTGAQMTKLYHEANQIIKKLLGGTDDYILMNVGNGTTGAIHRLTQILGIYEAPATKERYKTIIHDMAQMSEINSQVIENIRKGNEIRRPVVFVTPYEHHSNELTWREGDAEVIAIKLTQSGLLDLEDLEKHLKDHKYNHRMKIGAFSAASNVTGMQSPVRKLVQLMHAYDGYVFFDYAASAPYVEINVYENKDYFIDGIYFSPHKFLGGPGSSGVLLIHKRIYHDDLSPTCTGGGTVKYVNKEAQDYKKDIEKREDAGTPAILQTIRTALTLNLKAQIGYKLIEQIEHQYIHRALEKFRNHPNIKLVGQEHEEERISIFSFNIKYKDSLLHPRFITKLLNDLFGIQSRAGCSCAGPYGHYLLGVNKERSALYRKVILEGYESMRPGWVRVNFHYTLDEEAFSYIIEAILFLADNGVNFLEDYKVNHETGIWSHHNEICEFMTLSTVFNKREMKDNYSAEQPHKLYQEYFNEANNLLKRKKDNALSVRLFGETRWPELAWFYMSSMDL